MKRALQVGLAVWGSMAFGSAVAAPAETSASVFEPPEGCQLLATVQQKSCMAWQVMRCASDAPHEFTTYEYEDGELSIITRDLRGMIPRNIAYLQTGAALALEIPDDVEARVLAFDPARASDSLTVEVGGAFRLEPEAQVVVDGPALLLTRIEGSAERITVSNRDVLRLPGAAALRAEIDGFDEPVVSISNGEMFYDAGLRAAVGFRLDVETPDGSPSVVQLDQTPIEIATAGQRGFGAIAPISACAGLQTIAPNRVTPVRMEFQRAATRHGARPPQRPE